MALDNSGIPHISYIYYGTLVYVHFVPNSDPSGTINSTLVKAASNSKKTTSTVGMEESGTSIGGILLASFMLLGRLVTLK